MTTLGLFDKRIDGDDCLLELARLRFLLADMGAEVHGGTPEHLEWMLNFRPWEKAPVVAHLPRDFNLVEEPTRKRVLELAARFAGRVTGLVLHDHAAMATRSKDYIDAAWKLDAQLEKVERAPRLFIEYAAGLDPADFIRFFASIIDLDRVSACIDIGHVGLRAARAAYARNHRGEDIYALKGQVARLPQVLDDVEAAVGVGAAAAFDLLEAIAALKKPIHFHLHDAHPLSTVSPFGISDHLSFLTEIPLSFEYHGRRVVATMFGPAGLTRFAGRALELLGAGRLSFTLEIHPTREQLSLGDAAPLFAHWRDKTNAERMNHWLSVLSQNHLLLRQALQAPPAPAPAGKPAESETDFPVI